MHSTRLPANVALLAMSALILAAGLWARHLGADALAWQFWLIGVVPNWLILVVTIVRSLMRRQAGVDVLAAISISFALLFGEVLVVAVIALMLVAGHTLEDFAQACVQREMTALLGHAPKRTNHFVDGQWHQVSLEKVQAGDRLLVRHGEVMPVDGTLSGLADLDESTLTGESLTRHRLMADAICSGVLDVGAAFEMTASASAEKSVFMGVVRLISVAQSERSPPVRLVDRYVFAFGGVATLLAGASWIPTGDSARCFAVLVVATPCPLILVVPVAIVSGLSRCTKRGVLVKGGGVLEWLALADTLSSDKVGTLTSRFTQLVDVERAPRYASNVVLGLVGSIVQASSHVTAETVAKAVREQGAKLRLPGGVVESPGAGVCGRVDGHAVFIGSLPYVPGSSAEPFRAEASAKRMSYAGASAAFVDANDELVDAL